MVLALLFALRAVGDAARIAFFLQVLKAGFVIRKALKESLYGQSQMFRDALFRLHGRDSMAGMLLDVKGYLPRNYTIGANLMKKRKI